MSNVVYVNLQIAVYALLRAIVCAGLLYRHSQCHIQRCRPQLKRRVLFSASRKWILLFFTFLRSFPPSSASTSETPHICLPVIEHGTPYNVVNITNQLTVLNHNPLLIYMHPDQVLRKSKGALLETLPVAYHGSQSAVTWRDGVWHAGGFRQQCKCMG